MSSEALRIIGGGQGAKRKKGDDETNGSSRIDDFLGEMVVKEADSQTVKDMIANPKGTFDITEFVEKLSLKDCDDLKAQTDKYDKIGVADTAIRSFAALHPTIVALKVTLIKSMF